MDEYLDTPCEPDTRDAGTQLHGLLVTIVGSHLRQYRKSHRIQVFFATHLRVAAGRHRIPDVMVLETPYRRGKIVTDVPAVTVEIKSPDDTFDDIVDKCLEYEVLGVRNILVMDPDNKRTWLFEQNYLRLLAGTSVTLHLQQQPALDFPFAEMFAELDED